MASILKELTCTASSVPSEEELSHDYLWRYGQRLPRRGQIVKLFLNVSREEQRQRFLKRIEAPEHNWKFSSADIREREHWDDYQRALSAMLSHTSTEWAPWYIDPQYPRLDASAHRELEAAKARLEAEAPESAHAAPEPS